MRGTVVGGSGRAPYPAAMGGTGLGGALTETSGWGEEGGSYSVDGTYRWCYARDVGAEGAARTICWIGLNPGTGDREGRYRPTLQRVVDRSVALGMGRIVLVNLFAWRATKPADLKAAAARGVDVVGAACDDAIERAAGGAEQVVAAWGSHGSFLGRDAAVLAMLGPLGPLGPLWCLGTTAKGHPRHPLYVGSKQDLLPLSRPAAT